jgi:hypothetical protein
MDKEFSSTSLAGVSYWLLGVGLYPARPAERFARRKPINPPGDYRRRAEPPPGPPAPTDGSRSPIPADPPAPTLVRRPDPWRKAGFRTGVARRPAHPTLDQPGGHLEDLARGLPDMPAVRLAARFRQGAAAGHPPGHHLRRSVPPADTRAVAGRAMDLADLFTVRSAGHPQFEVTAQPMGLDPVRTATANRRTPPAPSVRPCARPAGHGNPRGLHVLG